MLQPLITCKHAMNAVRHCKNRMLNDNLHGNKSTRKGVDLNYIINLLYKLIFYYSQ